MSARVVTPFGDFLADLGETRRGGGETQPETNSHKDRQTDTQADMQRESDIER